MSRTRETEELRPLDELRSAIIDGGYRYDWFARQIGLNPTYLSHQLAGRKRPHPELFRRAAGVLRCEEALLKPRADAIAA